MVNEQNIEMKVEGRPVWAEVSGSALTYNLRLIRDFVNPQKEKRTVPRLVLSVVKGNAYGHGGPQVAKILERGGSDWFGVTSVAEGVEVRKAGVHKPILVLTSFWPGEESKLFEYDLTPVVHRFEQLRALDRVASESSRCGQAKFHLKIETGMNRLGIPPGDIDSFARELAKCRHLHLGGIFTHFSSPEAFAPSPLAEQTQRQRERFNSAVERLCALAIDPGIVHLANGAAIATRPDTWGDMVRPGVILYGYHASFDPPERRTEAERVLPVRPVMSLRTRVINLRCVPVGESAGYNAKFVAQRPSTLAVLAAGYGDGVHRSLSNCGEVLIRGKRAPIVGMVSIDVTMVDVTEIADVEIGDIATVYGSDGGATLPANQVARSIGTVTSDLLCAISHRVPRVYVA